MADYYVILGVPRTASFSEVREAYMKLAKERHPDRFSDPMEKARADEFFKELTAAYNTLSHENRRKAYDAELEQPRLTAPEDIARDAYARGLQAHEDHEFQLAVDLLRVAVHHQPSAGASWPRPPLGRNARKPGSHRRRRRPS
jgi:DnaJ-class molecular chaperone